MTYPFARNLFRGSSTESARFGELYAEFLRTHYRAQRIAIFNGRDEYARNEADALTAKLKDWYGMAPVLRTEFNLGDKDFTAQLASARQAQPDVIAFFGFPAEGAIAIRQARDLGMQVPFFVGTTMVELSLIAASKWQAEGVKGFSVIPLLPNSGSVQPAMVQWEKAWRREYPGATVGRPGALDVMAYADTYVLAEGLRRGGRKLTVESFIRGMESIKNYRVSAIATPRSFSTRHHIGNMSLVPMAVSGGSWEPLNWQSQHDSDILKRYD